MASLLPLLLLLALLDASRATNFEAGDSQTYNHWASKNHFHVGDIVHFKYNVDSVMEVTEEEYNKCESSHPIFFSNNGNTEVRLDRPGPFYFISGATGHCQGGQRMVIKRLHAISSIALLLRLGSSPGAHNGGSHGVVLEEDG
ncbi:Early nodulin-like protein 1 [Triticum urartu]|uniref:Early nodulin-like protein 1 n=1 Tax=Triticum urartu TaxID=4572 RepID=M8AEU3_TRIUA|nr:Early nodulin-like protein 1 [Triticum urartu]